MTVRVGDRRQRFGAGSVDLVSWSDVAEFERGYICTVAPWQFWLAERDGEYAETLNSADLILPDGNGVLFLLRLRRLAQERITGRELVEYVANETIWQDREIVVVGGSNLAGTRLSRDMGWTVFGGDFSEDILADRAAQIVEWALARRNSCRVYLIALGSPRQELMARLLSAGDSQSVSIGIGGAVESIAGTTPRPPDWVVRMKIEFLHRAASQPHLRKRVLRALCVGVRLSFAELIQRRPYITGLRRAT